MQGMASTLSDPQVAFVALQSIERAIKDLWRPTGTVTTSNEFGSSVEDAYPIGRHTRDRWGQPPRMWPEVIAVTEALIGSAFAVAQAYLKTKPAHMAATQQMQDIEHVANYWKHRDEWGPPWGTGIENPRPGTLAAITRLGATPPIRPGQMVELAQVALGAQFDAEAVWRAIA